MKRFLFLFITFILIFSQSAQARTLELNDEEYIMTCSTLAKHYRVINNELFEKYSKQGIKTARKIFTAEQLKRMCLFMIVDYHKQIYPSNEDIGDNYFLWNAVYCLYEDYFGTKILNQTGRDFDKLLDDFKREYKINYDDKLPSDVKDILAISAYSEEEI